MRSIPRYIRLGLFLVVLGAGACHGKLANKAMKGIEQVPAFTILSVDSSHILKSGDIPQGRPIVFFLFDPGCPHCQKMTAAILQNEPKLKNVLFYFISDSSPKDVDTFSRNHRLADLNNIVVGLDYQFSFFNAFMPSAVPYVAIYRSNRKLEKTYYGEFDVQSFIKLFSI